MRYVIIAAVCLVVSARLFGYAMHGLPFAVAGVAGAFFSLMGLGAVRAISDDSRRGRWD